MALVSRDLGRAVAKGHKADPTAEEVEWHQEMGDQMEGEPPCATMTPHMLTTMHTSWKNHWVLKNLPNYVFWKSTWRERTRKRCLLVL